MNRKLTQYCWSVLGLTVAVIVWGAWVRISGSGAGCGSHWPLCNGEILPRSPRGEMLVEFIHRISSGLLLLLVVGLFAWCRRALAAGHPARQMAAWSLFFVLVEALIGAALVLFELVGFNSTPARAIVIAVHLVNSFCLIAVLSLTAWWSPRSGSLRPDSRATLADKWLLTAGCLALLLVGATGAVTALGDTLFPADSLRTGLSQDFDAASHFLVRLRIWHPIAALLTAGYLLVLSYRLRARRTGAAVLLARMLSALVHAQVLLGALTVYFLAPLTLQIAHLIAADMLWLTFILFGASVLYRAEEVSAADLAENAAAATGPVLPTRKAAHW